VRSAGLARILPEREHKSWLPLDWRNVMGEMVQLKRPHGKTCPAYLATPKDWGLNDQIKKIADRLAEAGYRALVPDLYRGKVAKAADEATHMMSNLNFRDAAEQDIRGAVQQLKQASKEKVAVGGFCMGGALTLLAALRVPEMDAGACFYGLPPVDPAEFKKIKIPLIATSRTRTIGARPRRSMSSRTFSSSRMQNSRCIAMTQSTRS